MEYVLDVELNFSAHESNVDGLFVSRCVRLKRTLSRRWVHSSLWFVSADSIFTFLFLQLTTESYLNTFT